MILTIDTSAPLSLTDRTVLAALLNGVSTNYKVSSPTITVTAGSGGSGGSGGGGNVVDEEPTPETDASLLQQAVARAAQLVSEKKADKVRAALAAVGARRVGEIPEADVPAFLAALDEA